MIATDRCQFGTNSRPRCHSRSVGGLATSHTHTHTHKTCTEGQSAVLQETTEVLLVMKGKPGSGLDFDRQLSEENLAYLKSVYCNALKN